MYVSVTWHTSMWNLTMHSSNGHYQKEILADRWSPDSCSRGCGVPGAAPCSEPSARPSLLPLSSAWQLPRRSWGQSGSWLQQSGHLKKSLCCLRKDWHSYFKTFLFLPILGQFWVSCWKVHPPALTSLTAHSPGDTPCMSPLGPMHREAATGFPVAFNISTAHTASSTCSKYCNRVTSV